ncbi:long-chain fatty acid--CoA ligase [Candidatus Falkowbacteria bacterium]|nr:long-chain fatty acid--CoA ligase [Candidatus Falkowbacteria bacterium]
MLTIPAKFRETADKFANRTALRFKYQGAYIGITFAELKERVDTMAKGLAELGVTRGDRVAILSENRSEWVRTDLAVLSLGAISVPVHTTLSSIIIKHILNDSGSRVILVSNQEQFNKLRLVSSELLDLRVIIYINLTDSQNPNGNIKLTSLDEVMELGKKSDKEVSPTIEPDDLASLVYTSGTTALPKGVMLTHHNFMFDAETSLTAVEVTEKDSLLSFLPLSHVLERTAGYYAPLVCRGASIAYAENIKTLKENLKEIKPTVIVSVPRIFERIHAGIWEKVKAGGGLKYKIFVWALKQEPRTFKHLAANILVFKKIRKAFGGHLRFTISGGASLNHKLARFFYRIGITILEGYGLTETAPVVTVNRLDNIKFGTVGQHLPGVELEIAKDKEILVRGPNVMRGYYKQEGLTKEAIDDNGWFHTGDLGFVNSEGFLVIIGRKKEMISLSSGKIAWPESLEIILNEDRFISQSMVYGNNKSYLTALIIPDWREVSRNLDKIGLTSKEPDQLIKEEKLYKVFEERINKINEQFADWEKIRKFALLPREFLQEKDELTPTMKLRRQALEDHYQKELAVMYR